jgi:hypothetical protein
MPKTELTIDRTRFRLNGTLTYQEIPGSKPAAHGLLMNARFIQGIFDDASAPERFARFGHSAWDPEANTDRLIAALPQWYSYGLRAFTVGIQGGGPCFTIDNATIENNPFGTDGRSIDPAYARRLDRLVRAADEIGMAVIVSFFYGAQAARIADGIGIRNAVQTAARLLRENAYTNVIIEVANEQNIPPFQPHPIVHNGDGMAWLIDLAREESRGMPVGCSGGGGARNREIVAASDVVLIHGNGQTRQQYYGMIRDVRGWAPDKPIVCNEDSQAIGQLKVAELTATSWGYYNNMTKQEPPADWSVLPGEDHFFAIRMAEMTGIETDHPGFDEQYYLQGFEPHMTYEGLRWPRLAALYPESVDYVEFMRNGELFYLSFDEPYPVHFRSNWLQGAVKVEPGETWTAVIHLTDGRTMEKTART